ncbi:PhzF family phenazine biosynthesis protein [Porifericola rhodea]|uniref:PhzF family phenazine biosynthesis protein n=1 Tax=Porifericola rhodea TaxID=930972 RepID=UPI002666CC5E|nr:PhzF family phenazine biosynthesis protein [Porifericola rhodea]WKN29552.1 PhzF family phenazine biosynthesis protein [Porifericola rhodea]
MAKTIQISQIDAFTNQAFGGNPAAVCITDKPLPEELMQNIAMEMNLAETAFLVKKDEGYHLRWFTPATEVKLCGHATLASAFVLWQKGLLSAEEDALFYTLSGELRASKEGEYIVLDFPATPAQEVDNPQLSQLTAAKPIFVGKNEYDYLLVFEKEKDVLEFKPDFNQMGTIECRGIIVSAPSSDGMLDIVSRFFAPACGINEDPVTGSAHCTLAPYWSAVMNKNGLKAYQASARGGHLELVLQGDRVKLKGQAVAIMEASLLLPS